MKAATFLVVLFVLFAGFGLVVAQDDIFEYLPGCFNGEQTSINGDIASISEEGHLVVNGQEVSSKYAEENQPIALCTSWNADGAFLAVQFFQKVRPSEGLVGIYR